MDNKRPGPPPLPLRIPAGQVLHRFFTAGIFEPHLLPQPLPIYTHTQLRMGMFVFRKDKRNVWVVLNSVGLCGVTTELRARWFISGSLRSIKSVRFAHEASGLLSYVCVCSETWWCGDIYCCMQVPLNFQKNLFTSC